MWVKLTYVCVFPLLGLGPGRHIISRVLVTLSYEPEGGESQKVLVFICGLPQYV